MKLKLRFFIIVNVLIGAVGVICILAGLLVGGKVALPLLEAVGTGLLAAAAVNILDRTLSLEPPPETKQRVEVVAESRVDIPAEIVKLKDEARKVDLVAVSLNHFTKELVTDRSRTMITRLLKHNLQLRIFLVHPASKYLQQRAFEDHLELKRLVEDQQEIIRRCAEFCGQLEAEYEALCKAGTIDEHLVGSLQIYLLDCCPYLTIYRVDDAIFWGLYTANTNGVNMPLFKTSMKDDPLLYNQLREHIHAFMGHEDRYPMLVHMPEMKKPVLNKKVLQQALATGGEAAPATGLAAPNPG